MKLWPHPLDPDTPPRAVLIELVVVVVLLLAAVFSIVGLFRQIAHG